tara:strand:+ start:759 stop:1094 length:336 start_codon:yes stop_codon:yes gene_type:complete
MTTMAVSLNGNGTDTLNNLFEEGQTLFQSFLDKAEQLTEDLKAGQFGNVLETFNTSLDALGVAKNLMDGDVSGVMTDLSGLTETYLDRLADSQDMDLDQAPTMTMSPSPGG